MSVCADFFTVLGFSTAPEVLPSRKTVGTYSIKRTAAAPRPRQQPVTDAKIRLFDEGIHALIEARETGVEFSATVPKLFMRFVEGLSAEMPTAETYVSSKGSLCLDWDENPLNQLSIVIQGHNRIAFAAYRKGERVHGSAKMASDRLPESVEDAIYRWRRNEAALSA